MSEGWLKVEGVVRLCGVSEEEEKRGERGDIRTSEREREISTQGHMAGYMSPGVKLLVAHHTPDTTHAPLL